MNLLFQMELLDLFAESPKKRKTQKKAIYFCVKNNAKVFLIRFLEKGGINNGRIPLFDNFKQEAWIIAQPGFVIENNFFSVLPWLKLLNR